MEYKKDRFRGPCVVQLKMQICF